MMDKAKCVSCGFREQTTSLTNEIFLESDSAQTTVERKNIADIIVAKHRNGPVGEVSLFFQASQTRFRDLEVTSSAE